MPVDLQFVLARRLVLPERFASEITERADVVREDRNPLARLCFERRRPVYALIAVKRGNRLCRTSARPTDRLHAVLDGPVDGLHPGDQVVASAANSVTRPSVPRPRGRRRRPVSPRWSRRPGRRPTRYRRRKPRPGARRGRTQRQACSATTARPQWRRPVGSWRRTGPRGQFTGDQQGTSHRRGRAEADAAVRPDTVHRAGDAAFDGGDRVRCLCVWCRTSDCHPSLWDQRRHVRIDEGRHGSLDGLACRTARGVVAGLDEVVDRARTVTHVNVDRTALASRSILLPTAAGRSSPWSNCVAMAEESVQPEP